MSDRRQLSIAVWRNEWLPFSETFIVNQALELRQSGKKVLCFGLTKISRDFPWKVFAAYGGPKSRSTRLIRLGTRLSRIVGRPLFLGPRFVANVRKSDIAVIHFLSDATSSYKMFVRNKIPVIVICHGYDVTAWATGQDLKAVLRRWLLRRMSKDVSKFIAVSSFIRDQLISLGIPSNKILVRYLGIPMLESEISSSSVEKKYDVLFVGRLVEKKGIMDLLSASLQLARSGSTPAIAIVGDGPLRNRIERFVDEYKLNVKILGQQSVNAVRKLMSYSKIFVGLSKTANNGDSEGLGMVFLEASLQGLPIISYIHGGVPEAVLDRKTGLLEKEGDIDSVCKDIQLLLSYPILRNVYGSNGHDYVTTNFDIRKCTELISNDMQIILKKSNENIVP